MSRIAQPNTRDSELGGKVRHLYSLEADAFETFVSSIMDAYVSYGLFTDGLFNGTN